MSSEQIPPEQVSLEQFSLEQVSSGAGPVHRPAEYGLMWGAYGLSTAKQASNEAGHRPSVDDFRPAPSDGARSQPRRAASCLDVSVMFDVCLPRNLGPQNLDPQNLGPQRTGGDFADVVPLQGDWVAVFLGDACGQGAAAALAVPQALYSLRQLLSATIGPSGNCPPGYQPSAPCWDPAHTLKRLNRHLCSPAQPAACASVSVSLAVLNTKTGEARCACAGSEPPLILRSMGQIETIGAGRMALGIDIGRQYHSVDFLLREGDALLLATDGVTEARNANSDESKNALRYEGLTELALEAFNAGGSPGRMARAVLGGARKFAGGRFHDHASVLVAALNVM